jgi:glycosyltransferase involved in cell wall biosynthesis
LALKVLFITSEFITSEYKLFPGGIATYTFNICSILLERNYVPTVLCLGSQNEIVDFHGINCRIIGNSTYRIKKLLNKLSFGLFNRIINRSTDAIMIYLTYIKIRRRFDIVQVSSWKYPGLFIKPRNNFILRISSLEKYLDNEPNSKSIDKWLDRRLERFEIRKYANIIGPGKFMLNLMDKELGTKSTFMPTPFIMSEVSKVVMKANKSILFVGTLGYNKGIDLILSIANKVLSDCPNSEFTIVGKFSRTNTIKVKKTILELKNKFDDRFLHIENLTRKELNLYYSKSEIVCIPSVYDNFPNVALEGMSNSCIVVASNTSSLDTLIMNGKNGYILDTRNVEDWIRVIHQIFNMNSFEKLILQTKISESLQQHSPDNAGNKLVEYYKSIIS